MNYQSNSNQHDAHRAIGNDASPATSPETRESSRTPIRWAIGLGLLGFSLLAAIMLPWESVMVRFFGPPRVEMGEAYAASESGLSVDHTMLDQLLKQYVDNDGWIDYAGLKEQESELDQYLQVVAEAPFVELSRDGKLALLINAYNAYTLKLIVEKYPLDSIQDIPAADRWDAVRWEVGGRLWSLNQIEHEQIRPKFVEPRIHFALVCAALSCPPLRSEAFTAERLEQQLEEQAQYVHDHGTWFQFDAGTQTASLTKLYSWYGDDFTQTAGSPLKFASGYSSLLNDALAAGQSPRINWLPYDWALNSVQNKGPR